MKKTVLFVLLFAAALAASAQTYEPKWNVSYNCSYSPNYSGPASNPGWSYWTIRVRSNPSLIWAYETFKVDYLTGRDNHAVAWAKPVPHQEHHPPYTSWEFTDGAVQCKDTRVYTGSNAIDFYDCNDGHNRHCNIP
jgi:hypothetical protein